MLHSYQSKSNSAYQQAGVNAELCQKFVAKLAFKTKPTFPSSVLAGIGGFAAVLDPKKLPFDDPLWVVCCDGVGTKLLLALENNRLDTVGVDLVAMSANDLLCCGAQPLYFADYFACSQLAGQQMQAVLDGIFDACNRLNCTLIGGETAEMPGLYQGADFDVAGFMIGAVERKQHLQPLETIQPGMSLIGIASTGPHANGYSLIRKLIKNQPALDRYPELLAPTRLYEPLLRPCLMRYPSAIAGLAHITGGGIADNLARILPATTQARIQLEAWSIPDVFTWLAELGQLSTTDMREAFNLGLGMIAVVESSAGDAIIQQLRDSELRPDECFHLGQVVTRPQPNAEPVVFV